MQQIPYVRYNSEYFKIRRSVVRLLLRVLMNLLIISSGLTSVDNQYWVMLLAVAYIGMCIYEEAQIYMIKNLINLVELSADIVFNNIDLIWALLFNDHMFLIWFFCVYYIQDFIFRRYYHFNELDDFTLISNLFLCLTIRHIWYKKNIIAPLLFSLFMYLSRLAHIWLIQWYALNKNNYSVVSIQATNFNSADSAHLLITVGLNTYEIFGARGNKVPQSHGREVIKQGYYYIPFNNYGIIGISDKTKEEADKIYRKMIDENPVYNSSSNSCQEFAFEFANKVVIPQTAIKLYMTNLKALLTGVSIYIIPLALVIYSNVSFAYKD